ncbi:MAG: tetratricopeptide repeat protein, partial [Calditrichaeota bacterium]
YHIARNYLGSRRFSRSLRLTLELLREIEAGKRSTNPDFPFLVQALLGRTYHALGRLRRAREAFEAIIPRLNKMEDEFRRAWIYIHYARCLRNLGEYDLAEKMLNKAHSLDDDYTRVILEREKFILRQRRQAQRQPLNPEETR